MMLATSTSASNNTASTNPNNMTSKSSIDKLLSYILFHINNIVICSNQKKYYQHMLLPDLPTFIKLVYKKSHLTPTILIIALIYLKRLKKNLPHQAQGEYDTPYKLYLAAIMIATKYVEDNRKHISTIYKIVSPLYTLQEINEMERSFLGVLKFDLYVDLSEMDDFIEKHQDLL